MKTNNERMVGVRHGNSFPTTTCCRFIYPSLQHIAGRFCTCPESVPLNSPSGSPPSSAKTTYLCTKAIKSAALPDPSHTTTGTGGVSVTYSKTARIVFMPPSITRQTTGVLEWVTAIGMQILHFSVLNTKSSIIREIRGQEAAKHRSSCHFRRNLAVFRQKLAFGELPQFYYFYSELCNLHGCNFKLEMYFSSFRLRMISAPYFAWVPLSTSRKYACRLFSTANLEL